MSSFITWFFRRRNFILLEGAEISVSDVVAASIALGVLYSILMVVGLAAN